MYVSLNSLSTRSDEGWRLGDGEREGMEVGRKDEGWEMEEGRRERGVKVKNRHNVLKTRTEDEEGNKSSMYTGSL